jgi:hypothetical protein
VEPREKRRVDLASSGAKSVSVPGGQAKRPLGRDEPDRECRCRDECEEPVVEEMSRGSQGEYARAGEGQPQHCQIPPGDGAPVGKLGHTPQAAPESVDDTDGDVTAQQDYSAEELACQTKMAHGVGRFGVPHREGCQRMPANVLRMSCNARLVISP